MNFSTGSAGDGATGASSSGLGEESRCPTSRSLRCGKAQTSTHLFPFRHISRGAPSKLRLGGIPHTSTLSSRVPVIARFSGRKTLAPVARLGKGSRSKPKAPAGGVRKSPNPTTPERSQAPSTRNRPHPAHSKRPILPRELQFISAKSLHLSQERNSNANRRPLMLPAQSGTFKGRPPFLISDL